MLLQSKNSQPLWTVRVQTWWTVRGFTSVDISTSSADPGRRKPATSLLAVWKWRLGWTKTLAVLLNGRIWLSLLVVDLTSCSVAALIGTTCLLVVCVVPTVVVVLGATTLCLVRTWRRSMLLAPIGRNAFVFMRSAMGVSSILCVCRCLSRVVLKRRSVAGVVIVLGPWV